MNIFQLKKLSLKPNFSVRKSVLVWYRFHRWFFVLFFFLVLGFGTWNWYQNLYRYTWTETQKQEFLKTQANETNFRVTVFEKVIKELDDRKARNENIPVIEHDLFQLDKDLEKDK